MTIVFLSWADDCVVRGEYDDVAMGEIERMRCVEFLNKHPQKYNSGVT
jgi:hypothetical protein